MRLSRRPWQYRCLRAKTPSFLECSPAARRRWRAHPQFPRLHWVPSIETKAVVHAADAGNSSGPFDVGSVKKTGNHRGRPEFPLSSFIVGKADMTDEAPLRKAVHTSWT